MRRREPDLSASCSRCRGSWINCVVHVCQELMMMSSSLLQLLANCSLTKMEAEQQPSDLKLQRPQSAAHSHLGHRRLICGVA